MAFQLDIVTPERTVYTGVVDHVQAPGSEGSFGVLQHHAPLLAALDVGTLSFRDEGESSPRHMACSGGFIEVLGDRVIVLAQTIELGDEIDLARAEASRERARERMRQREDVDMARAQAALERALIRIKVAGSG